VSVQAICHAWCQIAAAPCPASSSSWYAASTGALSALTIWLVMVTGWPGAGLRSSGSAASRWASAARARVSARRTWAGQS
jgi:hypothetical protein